MKKYYLLLLAFFAANGIFAQYTILHSFNNTDGAYPSCTLALSGRTLFGVTILGGAYDSGCIFSMDTTGSNFRNLHDFRKTTGSNPFNVTLQMSGNKLFGMTQYGGAHDSGVIFSIDTNGANYKDIYDFDSTTGAEPLAGVTISGGRIFGMTFAGGTRKFGCVFSIDTNGTHYKKLLDFTDTNGSNPYGVVTILGNKLYGMTSNGGATGSGEIFSLDTTGTNFTDLYDFNGPDGQYPNNLLTPSNGHFFGMAYQGGAGNNGNVFSIDTNGTSFKDLVDFQGTSNPFGANPYGDVILKDSMLYGFTSIGGAVDSGCIFAVDTNGTHYADIHDFSGPDGDLPVGNPTIAGTNMYGTTQVGGAHEYGVIFRLKVPKPAGVNNISNTSSSVKLYPNPNNGMFTIKTSEQETKNIEIYNELGEIVYSQPSIFNSQFNVDLSSQPAGIYFYRLLTDRGGLLQEGKLVIAK